MADKDAYPGLFCGNIPLYWVGSFPGKLSPAIVKELSNLGTGTAAGLRAGATTESAAVGVAIDAFGKTGADAAAIQAFEADVATAFAVAYLVGVIATIILIASVAFAMSKLKGQ